MVLSLFRVLFNETQQAWHAKKPHTSPNPCLKKKDNGNTQPSQQLSLGRHQNFNAPRRAKKSSPGR
jgi:hypothetical protein